MTRQSSLLSAQDRAMLNLRAHLVFNGAKQSDLHILLTDDGVFLADFGLADPVAVPGVFAGFTVRVAGG